MLYNRRVSNGKWPKLLALFVAILALFLLSSCGAGVNYGHVDRDKGLYTMFHNYEVLPDHRYYTTGGYDSPNAVLALHSDYELENTGNFWIAIPGIRSGEIRKWVESTGAGYDRWSDKYFASYILDPDDNRIGAWFAFEEFPTIKFLEGNRIQVYPPDLHQGFPFQQQGAVDRTHIKLPF